MDRFSDPLQTFVMANTASPSESQYKFCASFIFCFAMILYSFLLNFIISLGGGGEVYLLKNSVEDFSILTAQKLFIRTTIIFNL